VHEGFDLANPHQGGLPHLQPKAPIIVSPLGLGGSFGHQGLQIVTLFKGLPEFPLQAGPGDEVPAL
jgi:hypothetical protein